MSKRATSDLSAVELRRKVDRLRGELGLGPFQTMASRSELRRELKRVRDRIDKRTAKRAARGADLVVNRVPVFADPLPPSFGDWKPDGPVTLPGPTEFTEKPLPAHAAVRARGGFRIRERARAGDLSLPLDTGEVPLPLVAKLPVGMVDDLDDSGTLKDGEEPMVKTGEHTPDVETIPVMWPAAIPTWAVQGAKWLALGFAAQWFLDMQPKDARESMRPFKKKKRKK